MPPITTTGISGYLSRIDPSELTHAARRMWEMKYGSETSEKLPDTVDLESARLFLSQKPPTPARADTTATLSHSEAARLLSIKDKVE